ncbi:unnamed protein product [Nezara viridula]|uniref:Neuropeptide n=1 Tax=Nezara viridula TaxID=85310 RepID=A0A9P0EBH0_NEZVI|nr:unnamed protein product [Nezara viridula]
MTLGTTASLVNGIMLPFTSLLFGDLTSAFVSQEKYAKDPRYLNNTALSYENMFARYQPLPALEESYGNRRIVDNQLQNQFDLNGLNKRKFHSILLPSRRRPGMNYQLKVLRSYTNGFWTTKASESRTPYVK